MGGLRAIAGVLLVAGLAAGCEETSTATPPDPSAGPDSAAALPTPVQPDAPADPVLTPNTTAQQEMAATLPVPGEPSSEIVSTNVPHIYMVLQPGSGSAPTSVVFAIDRSRDNSPSDDPAIRISPEDTGPRAGTCNPQELRRFNFGEEASKRPVFGPEEAREGITARELPNFMAIAVTGEMMRQGLVVEPEDSRAQNICTRKLWEQLTVQNAAQLGG